MTVARGNGDGSSKENASGTKLVDTDGESITLFTYNAKGDDDKDELLVELHFEHKPDGWSLKGLEYGFCVEYDPLNEKWDCAAIKADINDSDRRYDFNVYDLK